MAQNIRCPMILLFVVINLVTVSARGVTQSADLLPVTGVTLFSTGVGIFHHEGIVNGNADLTLAFDSGDMDDLLKSLVLQDYDGGSVEAVTYPSQDPLERTLKSFSLDISDNPSLAILINRARGESVRVDGEGGIQGTVGGIEYRNIAKDGVSVQRPVLNLVTADGYHQMILEDVRTLEFTNLELQRELDAALGLIAANRHADKKPLTIRFAGDGRRRVSLSYVREVPVWKTSYRLVLGDEESGQLQLWAMVENSGENDWENVELGLATGMPISFIMDLYSPVYVERPRVEADYGVAAAPQLYDRERPLNAAPSPVRESKSYTFESLAESPPESSFGRADSMDKALDLTRGVQAAARVEGESLYRIESPVSVPRRAAALLPILTTMLPVEQVSVYDRRVLEASPLKAVRITNNSGVRFPAGPATIFNGPSYAGDARIPSLEDGEERLLSYAVDTQSAFVVETSPEPEKITELRVVNGFLESTIRLVSVSKYKINRLGKDDARFLIVHPKREGWNVEGAVKPVSETQSAWRFEIVVPAGGSALLPVSEQYIQSRKVALSSISDEQILFYLSQQAIDAQTGSKLERLKVLRADLNDRRTERTDIESRINDIHREQERIRRNLGALERGSELYRRYVSALDSQEDELQNLAGNLEKAKAAEAIARRRLESYLGTL